MFVSAKSAYAFTDDFNVSIDPDAITQEVNPGKSYNLSVELDTSNTTLTVFTVAFDLPSDGDYNTSNSWITFDSSSLTLNNTTSTILNFTLTIPQDASNGEYTKAIGVSDIPFQDGESDNPPIIMGIPITVQISGAQDQSSSSSSTSTTTTAITPTTHTTPISSPTPTSKPKVVTKIQEKQPPKADLYSEVKVTDFHSFLNPLNQTQNFTLKLKNEGNISSTPRGFISFINSQNQVISTLPLNESKLPIKPNSEIEYPFTFKFKEFLLGRLQAQVWLGYTNSQKTVEPQLKESIYFYYISPQPLTIAALTLLISILLLKVRLPHLHFRTHYRYFSIFLIAVLSSGLLAHFYKTAERQAEKSLGVQTSLNVTATVKQAVGIKTATINGNTVIFFAGTNNKGVKLFSLQKNSRQVLAEITGPSATITSYTLSGTKKRFPMLYFTRGY